MDKSLENLKEYVQCVKDLEIVKYTLQKTMEEIDRKISWLGIRQNISKKKNQYEKKKSIESVGCGCIIAFLMGLMLCLSLFLLSSGIDNAIAWGSIILTIFVGALALIIRDKYLERRNFEEEEKRIEQTYNMALIADERRVKREKVLREKMQEARANLQECYDSTCRTLEAVYAKNVIYDEYRHNLVAICMFSKYLQSGMCNSLQGSDGAYARYETDIRLGLILYKLEQIVNNLEAIRQNQYTLYTALKQANAQQVLMIQNLEQISANQQVQSQQLEYIEYNTQVLRQNSDIERWISKWDTL